MRRWTPQPIFGLIGRLGGVARPELERTFNQGIGMVAVVAATSVDATLARLSARGLDAWVVGAVRARATARPATLRPRAAAAARSR